MRGGRVFLSSAVFWSHDESGRQVEGLHFRFFEAGSVLVTVMKEGGGRESPERPVDVSANFEAEPEVGEYQALFKRERVPTGL